MVQTEQFKQAWYYARLSLSLDKIGCASAILKQAWYCARLSLSLDKIGCASAILKQAWYCARLTLSLYQITKTIITRSLWQKNHLFIKNLSPCLPTRPSITCSRRSMYPWHPSKEKRC